MQQPCAWKEAPTTGHEPWPLGHPPVGTAVVPLGWGCPHSHAACSWRSVGPGLLWSMWVQPIVVPGWMQCFWIPCAGRCAGCARGGSTAPEEEESCSAAPHTFLLETFLPWDPAPGVSVSKERECGFAPRPISVQPEDTVLATSKGEKEHCFEISTTACACGPSKLPFPEQWPPLPYQQLLPGAGN